MVTLAGNHEAYLEYVLREEREDLFRIFLATMSGYATAQSYGVDWGVPGDLEAFSRALPPEHSRFLAELQPWHEDEHALFVHAGVPPGRHPSGCALAELVWEPYPAEERGKPVVVGHDVQHGGRPAVHGDRIAIDTGCGFGGPLTALILPDRECIRAWPEP